MKSLELLSHLNKKLLALIVLTVVLLCLVALEIVLAHNRMHDPLHVAQMGLFLVMLALALWIFRIKQDLTRTLRWESGLLKDQVSEQASQLEVMNQQISDIIEASPDLVWVKDTHGIYQSCNLAYANYTGRDIDMIVGKSDFDLTTPDLAESFRAHDRQTLAARKSTRIEERHTAANGAQAQLFEIIKNPVFDARGELVGVQGIGRNITERRAAELALAQANEQRHLLELCVANLNDVVLITEAEPIDLPGPRIVFVNDAFERMTGYSRAEALGQNPRMLQGPLSNRAELDRIRAAMTKWQPVHAELQNYKKDGEMFWVELDIVPVANAAGWFTHWIAVQRDITERKAAQAEMLYICDRALEASRLKSEFLSTISHEMRTPMNGVIGMAQVLQGTPLTDTQQMYLGHIVGAAQDYMQVIDKALDFSKLDAGQLPIDCLPFALQPLLQAVDAKVRPKATAKQLVLQLCQGAALPDQLLGDAHRLRQCLLYLLDNAIKFTSKGSVVLNIEAVHWHGAVPALRFAVTDTGVGLSETARARLFHPFVQGDGSVTRSQGGVGLGLVIFQQLVELMQGRYGVDSRQGQGSTFWFELPLMEAA